MLCIFCCFCVQNSLCSWLKKEDAFVTTGFDNRKKAFEKFFFLTVTVRTAQEISYDG